MLCFRIVLLHAVSAKLGDYQMGELAVGCVEYFTNIRVKDFSSWTIATPSASSGRVADVSNRPVGPLES